MRGYLKRFFLLGLAGTVFLGCIYGVVAYRYWNNRPKVSRNYSAELNAPLAAVSENQRAWPIYREALFAVSKDVPRHWSDNERQYERVLHVPEVVDHIVRQEPMLRRVREAAKLTSLGFTLADAAPPEDRRLRTRRNAWENDRRPESPEEQPSENPALLNVLLTAGSEIRELSRLLAAHAIVSANRGDMSVAVEDISAIFGMARQVREIPLLVNELLSFGQYGIALSTWGRLLTAMPDRFSKEQLLLLEREAKAYRDGRVVIQLAGERATFSDVAQRAFTDDGNGDGYGFAPELLSGLGEKGTDDFMSSFMAPLSAPRMWSRRRNVEEADRLFTLLEQELERPFWECDCDIYHQEMDRVKHDSGLKLVYLLLPALSRVHLIQQNVVQERDALLTASALARYRLDHGDWPDALDKLVPRYMSAILPDQFTGKPLGYTLVDDEPVVYSVGFDKYDDGGVPGIIESYNATSRDREAWHFSFANIPEQTKGDLILWPVQSPVVPLDPEPPLMRVDE